MIRFGRRPTGLPPRALVAAACLAAALLAPPAAADHRARHLVDEARVGLSLHEDSRFKRLFGESKDRDGGVLDVNLELRFAKPRLVETGPDGADLLLNPQPLLSAAVNLGDGASHAGVGLAWEATLYGPYFIEGAVGVAFHNGNHDGVGDGRKLGCNPLARVALSVGRRVTERLRVMLTVEHLENFEVCDENAGLTNLGVKLGYGF